MCNKEGHKKRLRSKGHKVLFPRDTQRDCLVRMGIVLNDMVQLVLVKLITEHNRRFSVTPSKSRMNQSQCLLVGYCSVTLL